MNLALRILLFTLLIPGAVAGWFPWFILRSFPGAAPGLNPFGVFGLGCFLLGLGVYGWCAWEFAAKGRGTPAPYDPPRSLVRSGLYRRVRNPMYVGVLLILWGEALLWRSGALFIYALIVFFAFHLRVLLYEEPALRRQLGDGFRAYCREVPRWLPRWNAASGR